MFKLHVTEGPVTSTFKFASKEALTQVIVNVIKGAPMNQPVTFTIEEIKAL